MQTYTIKNPIKRIPEGMQLNRRIYYITSPIGLISKLYQEYTQEVFAIMRIVSYIRVAQKQHCDGKNLYVNISRDILVSCAGKNYRKYIDWLIYNEIIDVNESYSTEKKFTKSYRYTEKAYNKPISVTKWEVDVLDEVPREYYTKVNNTIFTPYGEYDTQLLYCLEHENALSIPKAEEVIDSLDDDMKSYASEWFYEINKGKCFPPPQNKSTRFYFNSIMMNSSLRKYLVYDKNKALINYDIKTAYPAFIKLLAMYGKNEHVIADEDNTITSIDFNNNIIYSSDIPTYVFSILSRGTIEKDCGTIDFDFYKNGDFYDKLSEKTAFDRKQVKIEYNKYINSNDTLYKKKHVFTKRLIEMGHEDMAEYIINAQNIWLILEAMETELMVDICNRCIQRQIPFIRQHDGFLTTLENKDMIEKILADCDSNSDYPSYSHFFEFKNEVYNASLIERFP